MNSIFLSIQALFDDPIWSECKGVIDTTTLIAGCEVDYCHLEEDSTLHEIYQQVITSCRDHLPTNVAVCTWKTHLQIDNCESNQGYSTFV